MNWKENINKITEIYPGQYQIILDFATNSILKYLIRNDYKFIWISNHYPHMTSDWQIQNVPVFDSKNLDVIARNITYDFIMPTDEFKTIINNLTPGITLVQMNQLPKSYLDLSKISGKTRYDLLLKECDYLFMIDIPSAIDYGILVSPDIKWLQSLLDDSKINWANLP